jgi:hypothetical protein
MLLEHNPYARELRMAATAATLASMSGTAIDVVVRLRDPSAVAHLDPRRYNTPSSNTEVAAFIPNSIDFRNPNDKYKRDIRIQFRYVYHLLFPVVVLHYTFLWLTT